MMADEIDVEAMLEAPFEKGNSSVDKSGSSRHRDRSRSRSRDRSRRHRDRSSDRRRDRDEFRSERRRERDRDRRDRDRDRNRDYDRRRDRDYDHPRYERSRRDEFPPEREREDSDDKAPKRFYRNGEPRPRSPELSPEERDARTVFVWQLSARIRQRDLEDFFSSVGKIRDVRLIIDGKTKRSKGIAYVEFREVESAQLALGLTGTKLLGVPIQIQQSHAEKNRAATAGGSAMAAAYGRPVSSRGPMKLYVGSLHFNITEEMLRGIFEPFGKLDDIKLIKDPQTNRSQGYGFVTYSNGDDARKALDQLNGFDLAGRAMKVNYVTERSDYANLSALDNEEADRTGVDLGTTGRLALMAKLAEGTGLEMPKAALAQLQGNPTLGIAGKVSSSSAVAPPVCTQCFMLSNMFDPHVASHTTFEEIKDDVISECSLLGGVLHIFVDQTSAQGNVYVKCPSIAIATQCVNKLHGRYFSGRLVTAAYVPLITYNQLFPDSVTAKTILKPTYS
ncbi:RNA-binding protein 39 [Echinococcus granulosus]|uniref:RNA binding protein 39 n=1 Tax=Echinococcus granulosus TaxID=6210 RepID=A0A068WER6_ECHGR|nr:RNA-binding protein 39 [Echinococcus granulosus]CDS18231.1 RNA binding protein 39 [Echinococcus granulosus]